MNQDFDAPGLVRAAAALGVQLEEGVLRSLRCYVEVLLVWRERMSLTTASTVREIVEGHILDSLAVVPQVSSSKELADIGSGAGFPGLPIAMVLGRARVTLIEARRKRVSFLREVVRQTKLTNVEICESRVEDKGAEFSKRFDVVVSRAFGSIEEFLGVSRPILMTNGIALAMKGPKGYAEAIEYPGFCPPEIYTYDLPGLGQRILVSYKRN